MNSCYRICICLSFLLFTLLACGQEEVVKPALQINKGACNASDRSRHIYRRNAVFLKKWEECGRETWGDGPGTTQCLIKHHPTLSAACAACFGDHVACTKSNCWWKCGPLGTTSSCEQCSVSSCEPGLVKCSGVDSAALPSKY